MMHLSSFCVSLSLSRSRGRLPLSVSHAYSIISSRADTTFRRSRSSGQFASINHAGEAVSPAQDLGGPFGK